MSFREFKTIATAVGLMAGLSAHAACTLTGSGTVETPYQVGTAADLAQVGTECAKSASYVQTANITLNKTVDFPSIGSVGTPFTGVYDGGGFKITDLNQTRTNVGANGTVGLFGGLSVATVKNLTLQDAVIDVEGALGSFQPFFVGVLAGRAAGASTIEEIHIVNPAINLKLDQNDAQVGAITGRTEVLSSSGPTINKVRVSNLTVTGSTPIGVAGNQPTFRIGGAIGFMNYGILSQTSATGQASVTNTKDNADYNMGGLLGHLDTGTIRDAYANVSLSATDAPSTWGSFGGIVGSNAGAGNTIERVYAAGQVSGTATLCGTDPSQCSGILGRDWTGLTINASFWDTDTTTRTTSQGGGTGKTTAQMKQQATFLDAGWGIVAGWQEPTGGTVWGIESGYNSGYPYLLWAAQPRLNR